MPFEVTSQCRCPPAYCWCPFFFPRPCCSNILSPPLSAINCPSEINQINQAGQLRCVTGCCFGNICCKRICTVFTNMNILKISNSCTSFCTFRVTVLNTVHWPGQRVKTTYNEGVWALCFIPSHFFFSVRLCHIHAQTILSSLPPFNSSVLLFLHPISCASFPPPSPAPLPSLSLSLSLSPSPPSLSFWLALSGGGCVSVALCRSGKDILSV